MNFSENPLDSREVVFWLGKFVKGTYFCTFSFLCNFFFIESSSHVSLGRPQTPYVAKGWP